MGKLEDFMNSVEEMNNKIMQPMNDAKAVFDNFDKSDKKTRKEAEKERLKELEMQGIPYCPKCHSTSLTPDKQGYGIGKGVVGGIVGTAVAGPVGLVGLAAGNINSKKIKLVCLNCGNRFKPGKK